MFAHLAACGPWRCRAFLGELDSWCRANEYVYADAEKEAAKQCGKKVVSRLL